MEKKNEMDMKCHLKGVSKRLVIVVALMAWNISIAAGPRFDRYDHVSHNHDEGGGFALLILLIILAFIYLFRKK